MIYILNEKLRKLFSSTDGFAVGLTLLVWPLMLVMVSGIYVNGESIIRKVQLQNAVDASAYAGAQVQADTLSRVAVLNRMMAWTYIQANKMEMDYTVRNWADLTNQAMDAVKAPLSEINQTLSLSCPDLPHKSERTALSGSDWGWYAGLNSTANGYLPGTMQLNSVEVAQDSVTAVTAATADLESLLGDAYGNLRSMNDAMEDLLTGANGRIKSAAQKVFAANTKALSDPTLWVRDLDFKAMLPILSSEKDFMLLATAAYDTIKATPGFDQWWNLDTSSEGFRREYKPTSVELKSVFSIGFKGWARIMSTCSSYLTGETEVNVFGNGSVVLNEMRLNGSEGPDLSNLSSALEPLAKSSLAYNTGGDPVYAKPRMVNADFLSKGAVVTAAKLPLANPLVKIFGDLTGSWYDAHTVTGTDVWCAAAARACAKHPSKAGYSRTDLASYTANTADYAAIMLPLGSAGSDAGSVLKEVHGNLNVSGWDDLADWSVLNTLAAQK